MPPAGTLRHRVLIQQRADGVDDAGEPLDDWTDFVTVWADIVESTGREYVEGRQVPVNEVGTNIIVRYRTDLYPEMRARELCHYRREYKILDVRPYDQGSKHINDRVLLQCEELRTQVGAA